MRGYEWMWIYNINQDKVEVISNLDLDGSIRVQLCSNISTGKLAYQIHRMFYKDRLGFYGETAIYITDETTPMISGFIKTLSYVNFIWDVEYNETDSSLTYTINNQAASENDFHGLMDVPLDGYRRVEYIPVSIMSGRDWDESDDIETAFRKFLNSYIPEVSLVKTENEIYHQAVPGSVLNEKKLVERAAAFADLAYNDGIEHQDSIEHQGRGFRVRWENEEWELYSAATYDYSDAKDFRYMIFTRGNDVMLIFRGMKFNKNFPNVVSYFSKNIVPKGEFDNAQAAAVYNLVHSEVLLPYLTDPSKNIYITGHSMGGYLGIFAYKYILGSGIVHPDRLSRVDAFNPVGFSSGRVNDINRIENSKIFVHQTCCDLAKQWSVFQGMRWPGTVNVDTINHKCANVNYYNILFTLISPAININDARLAYEISRAIYVLFDAHEMKHFVVSPIRAADSGMTLPQREHTPTNTIKIVNIACPVEVEVVFNGEALSSVPENRNTETSWGALYFWGDNDEIKTIILFTDEPVDIYITGYDAGTMDFEFLTGAIEGDVLGHFIQSNIPISNNTRIITNTNSNLNYITLSIDSAGSGVFNEELILTNLLLQENTTDNLKINVSNRVLAGPIIIGIGVVLFLSGCFMYAYSQKKK
jgi:hypothetical protein